jgi:hypothetical protein
MERWRAIPGWEGLYEISRTGQVRSVERVVYFADGRVREYAAVERATHKDGFGYQKVTLKGKGRNQRVLIHQAVAAAWVGPRPDGLEVCHNDGNKLNNTVENLRYDTRKANHADAARHGTLKRPRKITDDAVAAIRAARGVVPQLELAKRHGISKTHVCNIQRGNRRAA